MEGRAAVGTDDIGNAGTASAGLEAWSVEAAVGILITGGCWGRLETTNSEGYVLSPLPATSSVFKVSPAVAQGQRAPGIRSATGFRCGSQYASGSGRMKYGRWRAFVYALGSFVVSEFWSAACDGSWNHQMV
ncbi:unnamed protein product [Clonostachys rhizophaga]|uniref:Uncharacterized protein n=1 Tax=Clonostachys rhizophaga TaxID=160324 RepID=A0A9N9V3N2_9HYPO|nr:unnamed protein product [Clonostachys rhizophaga]